jgi:hypothetical protein
MMSTAERAKALVEMILADLTDRKGLRHAWDMIDEDIQEEIVETWQRLAVEVMTENGE